MALPRNRLHQLPNGTAVLCGRAVQINRSIALGRAVAACSVAPRPVPIDRRRAADCPSLDRRAARPERHESVAGGRRASLESSVHNQDLRFSLDPTRERCGANQEHTNSLHLNLHFPASRLHGTTGRRGAFERGRNPKQRCDHARRSQQMIETRRPARSAWRSLIDRLRQPQPLFVEVLAPLGHGPPSLWMSASASSISGSETLSRASSQRIQSRTFACARRAAGRVLSVRMRSSRAASS